MFQVVQGTMLFSCTQVTNVKVQYQNSPSYRFIVDHNSTIHIQMWFQVLANTRYKKRACTRKSDICKIEWCKYWQRENVRHTRQSLMLTQHQGIRPWTLFYLKVHTIEGRWTHTQYRNMYRIKQHQWPYRKKTLVHCIHMYKSYLFFHLLTLFSVFLILFPLFPFLMVLT